MQGETLREIRRPVAIPKLAVVTARITLMDTLTVTSARGHVLSFELQK